MSTQARNSNCSLCLQEIKIVCILSSCIQDKVISKNKMRVNIKSDNPEVSRTFLIIQFFVFLMLNTLFICAFLGYKYIPAVHDFIKYP